MTHTRCFSEYCWVKKKSTRTAFEPRPQQIYRSFLTTVCITHVIIAKEITDTILVFTLDMCDKHCNSLLFPSLGRTKNLPYWDSNHDSNNFSADFTPLFVLEHRFGAIYLNIACKTTVAS